ncbi:MAG: Na+/H+ antiporter NhaC family protein [Deltaproteobacteria bacterium]|nr:Na+/H+ antiporter NhaC family protein [Deltaproteobacteria bacterium]MBW1905342.1 Na+/H+ antiporter NhaC family protein [Deltaproteobacteria bacterium]MBW2158832.1 Na+/H+ antiporter NhaC family protein [Deltaproteobacteria bacterium]MBW2376019.1 Na+/H+ antiporter NhaC family protein [Deltaproteobacteria bacterium]
MRAVLVVLIVVGGFAAVTAGAIPNDGAAPTVIQNISLNITSAAAAEVADGGAESELPAWVSILPPLLAIALALLFRHVLLALVLGVWLGAFLISGLSPFASFARLLDTYIVNAIADRGHASILVFSLLLGGMLGLMTQSGGAKGLASWVSTDATSRRRGQLTTWFLGLLVFFDDYANSLLVGSSMRPVTDRLRISREKLAFLVDATAAPVASLALISSWIGVEVGYIGDQFTHLGIERDAYLTFIETIPFRFYPILMLVFVAWIAFRGRDFGPMLLAERRALEEGLVSRPGSQPASDFHEESVPEEVPGRPMNALLPVVAVVFVAAVGIYVDGRAKVLSSGMEPSLRAIVSEASSSAAILWATGAGCLVALALSVGTGALSFGQSIEAWMSGMRSMLFAAVILVLAWSLGAVCRDLDTASFLIGAVGDWIAPTWIPATVFLMAALVSFATGTSWGTMAILFPLVVPLAHEMAPGNETILLGTVSSILAGSVWGDHCSPISDTTVLSSMATSCDHMDHVRTQLPYALLIGGVSLLCAELPVAAGWYGPWVGLLVGAAVMIGAFELLSRPVRR